MGFLKTGLLKVTDDATTSVAGELVLGHLSGVPKYHALGTTPGTLATLNLNQEFTGNQKFSGTLETPATLTMTGVGSIVKSGTGGLTLATGANAVSMTWGAASALTMPTGTVTVAALQTAQTFTAAQTFNDSIAVTDSGGLIATFRSGAVGNGAYLALGYETTTEWFVGRKSTTGDFAIQDSVAADIISINKSTNAIDLKKAVTFSGGFAAQTISGAVTWSGAQTLDVASPNQFIIKGSTIAGIEFKIGATTTWQTAGSATEWSVYNYAGANFPLKLSQTAATINVPVTVSQSTVSFTAPALRLGGATASIFRMDDTTDGGSWAFNVGGIAVNAFDLMYNGGSGDTFTSFIKVSTAGAVTLGPASFSAGTITHIAEGSGFTVRSTGSSDTNAQVIFNLNPKGLSRALYLTTIQTDSGTNPAIEMDGRLSSAVVATRPLWRLSNYGNTRLEVSPSGVYNYNAGTMRAVGVTSGHVLGDTTVSRRELKDNIRDLSYGLDVALNLKPRIFEWKYSGETDVGMIADEVADVAPLLAYYNEEGIPDAVNYTKIAQIAIKAIQELASLRSVDAMHLQELSAKLDEAEARIQQLEGGAQ